MHRKLYYSELLLAMMHLLAGGVGDAPCCSLLGHSRVRCCTVRSREADDRLKGALQLASSMAKINNIVAEEAH
jgi:hypothetical protein